MQGEFLGTGASMEQFRRGFETPVVTKKESKSLTDWFPHGLALLVSNSIEHLVDDRVEFNRKALLKLAIELATEGSSLIPTQDSHEECNLAHWERGDGTPTGCTCSSKTTSLASSTVSTGKNIIKGTDT